MIQISNLTKIYDGVTVLNVDSLTIPQGESFGLVGNNGAGKTTLFKLITGLETPDSGEIKLGETVKEGKNQRTVLTAEEEEKIITTFNTKEAVEDLSVVVSKDEIAAKNYSFSAGQYFEVKIEYIDITAEEFAEKMTGFENRLSDLFQQGNTLDLEIQKQLKGLKYD